MRFYSRENGKISWQKPRVLSLLYLVRDLIIFVLPMKRLPRFLTKLLYGISPRFVFFVHARRTEDTYVGLPILSLIRRYLGKKIFLMVLTWLPPMVLGTVKSPMGVDGFIVTGGGILPEQIFLTRKASLKKAVQAILFSSKICERGAIFGLGGLWPMVTRRGLALVPFAKRYQMVVTNGHSGTLLSLYLSIQRIAEISEIPLEELKVMILGVGKMGASLAKVLYGKVAAISLVDVNEKRLETLERKLKEAVSATDIFKFLNKEDVGDLRNLFESNHIVACTTSNVRRILRPSDIPSKSVIIDDSRPEAIPRNLDRGSIVLEGGLLKVRGLKQEFNFGFGMDENVFGCLAESFMLAASRDGGLFNTLGDVESSKFAKLMEKAHELGVTVGDFRCRYLSIHPETIASTLHAKTDLATTIPFKKVCWLLKTEELLGIEA